MAVIAYQITSLTTGLLNRLFRRRSKRTSPLRVNGLCAGNSPVTGEFPAQMASNAENVSIGWRHHVFLQTQVSIYHKVNTVSARETVPTTRNVCKHDFDQHQASK